MGYNPPNALRTSLIVEYRMNMPPAQRNSRDIATLISNGFYHEYTVLDYCTPAFMCDVRLSCLDGKHILHGKLQLHDTEFTQTLYTEFGASSNSELREVFKNNPNAKIFILKNSIPSEDSYHGASREQLPPCAVKNGATGRIILPSTSRGGIVSSASYEMITPESFQEEKDFRSLHGWGSIIPWQRVVAEQGVRETLHLVSLLEYAFPFGWSHSQLPSDHPGVDLLGKQGDSPEEQFENFGYFNLRINSEDPNHRLLVDALKLVGCNIVVDPDKQTEAQMYKTFHDQSVYTIEVPIHTDTRDIGLYEIAALKRWNDVNRAIKTLLGQ